MIILFHCLSLLIFQLLRNRKRIKFLKQIEENIKRSNENPLQHVDLEHNLKFDPPVFRQRYGRVYETLLDERWRKQIKTLVDFGCAEFGLMVFIKRLSSLNSIMFVDIDEDTLKEHSWKLHPLTIEYLKRREQPLDVSIFSGSVGDPDYRLLKIDAVTSIELIEHLYPDVLDAFPYNIFSFIEPKIVIVTTPNADFNVLFSDNPNRFRHYDHKFEWTREQFEDWANNITLRFADYSVSFSGIGEGPKGTESLGQCSQMAVFIRKDILDDKYVSKLYGSPCLCDSDSVCKGAKAEAKLACNCVCALCTPSASYGVCTYYSYSKQIMSFDREDADDQFVSYNIYYKFITKIDYPFECDSRTEEEKMIDEFRYRINTFGQPWGRFYVEERERSEIPLRDIMYGTEGCFITEPELHKLLSKFGYHIEECRLQETGQFERCVVYTPLTGDTSDSTSEASGYDSDITKYQLNEESLSDWDDPYDNWDSSKPTESHQSSKADLNSSSEMTSRDNHHEAPTDVEEEKKQQDSLFDSGYQKSLSIPDDSPQTPVEDLEENDLFEETISTPSLTSEDNKVHLKRATALDKCAFPLPPPPDTNRVNELDQYRNMPSGRGFPSHPLPPPPPDVYRKSFLKDKDALPGPSSSQARKRKKFKKGLPCDSDDDSPLADVKSIATCILENTLNKIEINERDDLIEYVAPDVVEVVAEVQPVQAVGYVAAPVVVAVVENGDLANNNRDIEASIVDPEETDHFEDTSSTPSLSSQDNRVHLKKTTSALEKSNSAASANKIKAVDSNRVNELDRFGNMPPNRMFLFHVPPPPPVPRRKFSRDPTPGTSAIPRKRKRTKKDPAVDDDDSALDDVKSVARCILKNTLNMIDVYDEPELIEYVPSDAAVARPDGLKPADVSQESVFTMESGHFADSERDEEGNNYIAQDEAEDNVGNDIANDNLEIVVGEPPRVEEVNANVDNNNGRVEAVAVIEDPPRVIVEEPVRADMNADNVQLAENAIAKASREVLFDENSEQDLLEDFEIPAPIHEADPVDDDDNDNIRLVGIRLATTPENFETDDTTTDGFPNWLLQILGAQAVLEEVTPPGSQEGSHFYCQGDGLGVHPSVIAVEGDEDDEETTESSNNTADYGEAEQVSSQDMSSLPEDSQTNTHETEDNEAGQSTGPTSSEHDPFVDSNTGSDVGTNQNP